jgi:putative Mg2+ transporter-C (MgtC) family protein
VPLDEQLALVGRLAFAAVLGAFIGLQRELQGYPAGIRTLALVALGSALFTEVSRLLAGDDRAAAGIVTGIGFLGAGVIFREGYTVKGITTAASIWAAAGIGMAAAIELYLVAGLGALTVVTVLGARPLTRRMDAFLRRFFSEEVAAGEPPGLGRTEPRQ